VIARLAPVLLCTGCHLLFQLEEVQPTPDGDSDAPALNCTIPYVSPGDFDDDGIDNAHDLCPMVSGDMPDSDGDGVGENCDPHPTVAGDCVLVFQDFRETTLPCWTTNRWQYDGDGWSTPSPSDRETLVCSALASISYGIMIGRILEPSTDPLRAVLVMYRYGGGVDLTGDVCGVKQLSDAFAVTSGLWKNDMLTIGSVSPSNPTLAFQPAVVQLDRWTAGPSASLCTLKASTGTSATGATTDAYAGVTGRLAIHSIATRFRVQAFVGYGVGNACPR